MAQDTRKDPRAKVLTMTVRYKSATVDEFIEHHSHDVSRGGIYIKTPAPFQPGTLLKFEIRIADDKPMLQGVGRVVWKRESAGPGSEKPAGMGVKFIKVDEASRNLIDRLIVSKGDTVSSYDAEPAEPSAAGSLRSTQAGMRPGSSDAQGVRSPQGGVAMRRAGTMIGLGVDPTSSESLAAARGVQRPSQAPRPGDAMFPKTDSESEMPPPEERTVMKQAAQLLEEALKGAGGSIEELGGAHGEPAAKPAPTTVEPARSSGSMPASTSARSPGASSGSALTSGSAAGSATSASAAGPASRRGGETTEPTRAARQRPPLEVARASAAAPLPDKKPASGNTIAVSLLFVAAASVVAYVAWRKDAPDPAPEPTIATVAPPAVLPPSAPTIAEPVLVPPPAPAPSSPAVGAGSAATTTTPPAASSAAVAASAPLALPPRPTPAASATAPPQPVAPSVARSAAPLETGPAALHEASKPAPAPSPVREVVKAAPAPPRPKPPAAAPKPAAKPTDDNPY